MRPRVAALVLAAAVVAAGCSGDYDRLSATPATTSTTTTAPRATTTTASTTTTTTRPPSAPTTTAPTGAPTTAAPGSAAGLPGRLAVLALDGSLLTIRPDGTDPKALATASPGTSVASPTWTADATRLVWTALGTNSVRVRGSTVDYTDVREATLSPPATLFLPSPAGNDLVAIREPSASASELVRLDPSTLTATTLRSAPAIHATWSPDGTRLLVHAGNEIVVLRAGASTPVAAGAAGSFGAGQWLDDRTVVVAIRNGAAQTLAAVDLDTGTTRDLLSFTGAIRFLVDPTRARIAYQVLPETGGSSGSNVSFRQSASTTTSTTVPAPQATPGRLELLTLATRQVTSLGNTPVQMFQWSPTGERLAYLASDTSGALRWRFWGERGTIDGLAYVPPNVFVRVYSRIFDDAAAVVRWWSPDGRAFVYAGRAGSRNGVFVQQMDGTAPVLVDNGDTAVWSPR